MMMRVIKGEKLKVSRILLPTELIIRNSTCPLSG
jgi:DNA-binding LacI/PurR family transcriptional regulator